LVIIISLCYAAVAIAILIIGIKRKLKRESLVSLSLLILAAVYSYGQIYNWNLPEIINIVKWPLESVSNYLFKVLLA